MKCCIYFLFGLVCCVSAVLYVLLELGSLVYSIAMYWSIGKPISITMSEVNDRFSSLIFGNDN